MITYLLFWFKYYLSKMGVSEKGQGLVEYALIILLVSLVVIAVLAVLGDEIAAVFTRITDILAGAG
jgi:pilus assembly protein Flp/PilA